MVAKARLSRGGPPPEGLDAIVVGAGPAGLSAALYLARFRRSTLVLHDGTSRALTIPRTHNVPGFGRGIAGPDLLRRMASHARRYGARVMEAKIEEVDEGPDGFRLIDADGQAHVSRTLILATGMNTEAVDLAPETLEAAIAAGVLRYCPVCDGYEHRSQRIAVMGDIAHAAGEALFLRTYSKSVTLLATGGPIIGAVATELEAKGVQLVSVDVDAIVPGKSDIAVRIAGESEQMLFDVLYPARGSRPRNTLAEKLGLSVREDGTLEAHSPYGTAIPGLYAVGDIVEGLDQISVAMGHGAVAATRAHNWLREQDGWVLEAKLS